MTPRRAFLGLIVAWGVIGAAYGAYVLRAWFDNERAWGYGFFSYEPLPSAPTAYTSSLTVVLDAPTNIFVDLPVSLISLVLLAGAAVAWWGGPRSHARSITYAIGGVLTAAFVLELGILQTPYGSDWAPMVSADFVPDGEQIPVDLGHRNRAIASIALHLSIAAALAALAWRDLGRPEQVPTAVAPV
jgi:hypothetical protein